MTVTLKINLCFKLLVVQQCNLPYLKYRLLVHAQATCFCRHRLLHTNPETPNNLSTTNSLLNLDMVPNSVKSSCYLPIMSEIFHRNIRNLMLFRLMTNTTSYSASDSGNRALNISRVHPSSFHQSPHILSVPLFFFNSRWQVFLTCEFITACSQAEKVLWSIYQESTWKDEFYSTTSF